MTCGSAGGVPARASEPAKSSDSAAHVACAPRFGGSGASCAGACGGTHRSASTDDGAAFTEGVAADSGDSKAIADAPACAVDGAGSAATSTSWGARLARGADEDAAGRASGRGTPGATVADDCALREDTATEATAGVHAEAGSDTEATDIDVAAAGAADAAAATDIGLAHVMAGCISGGGASAGAAPLAPWA